MAFIMKSAHDMFQRSLLGLNTVLLAIVAFLATSTFKDFKAAVNTVNELKSLPEQVGRMHDQMNDQAVQLGVITSRLNYIEKSQSK